MFERFMMLPTWLRIGLVFGAVALAFGVIYTVSGGDDDGVVEQQFENNNISPAPSDEPVEEPSEEPSPTPSSTAGMNNPDGYNGETDPHGEDEPDITRKDAEQAETAATDGMAAYLSTSADESAADRKKRLSKYIDPNSEMYNEDWSADGLIESQEAVVSVVNPIKGDSKTLYYQVQFTVTTVLTSLDSSEKQLYRGEEEYDITVEKVGDKWLVTSYQEV